MKNLLSFVFILFFNFGFGQDFYKVNKSSYNTYNGYKWVEQTVNYPDNMYIIVKENEIKVTNNTQSKFVTYGENTSKYYDTHTAYTWSAYDQEGRSCYVIIKVSRYGSGVTFCFLYNYMSFDYETEKK